MQTATFNHNDFSNEGTAEADRSLLVKFTIEPRQDAIKSQEAGRPIFVDAEYIDIKIPGNRLGGVKRVATHRDKARFPEHYRLFKARIESGGKEELAGTLLTAYPALSRTMVEELAFFNVKTVEQLANMTDANLAKFMNGQKMKREAQAWLDRASDDAAVAKLEAELAERDARLAELEKKMESLLSGNSAPDSEDVDKPAPAHPKRRKKAE